MKNSNKHSENLLGDISSLARQTFGYQQLHAGQPEAIQALLSGQDTLVVMPTGGGKSAIYQLAALMQAGPVIVVSPLIALQQDQVLYINDHLSSENTLTKAALVNSTLSSSTQNQVWKELEQGELKFLFLAPEQLHNEKTLERLRAAKPVLFVVDEAHCVSTWGHDFRPDYLRLGRVIEALGHPVTLALTATAAPPVRDEIMKQLGMHEPKVIVQGFNRPNLHLNIEYFDEEEAKRDRLIECVIEYQHSGKLPGIIYTATRKETEELSKELKKQGVKSVFYHAGLKAEQREQSQQAFMADEAEVMVATVAFGMGIDKPNVRFVFHLDISDSIDSYYQEIGRAGRDGEAAQATLFYCPCDLNLRRFFSSGGRITEKEVQRVAQAFGDFYQDENRSFSVRGLHEITGLSQVKLQAILPAFESAGVIQILADGSIVLDKVPTSAQTENAATDAIATQERRRHFEKSRLEMMQGYAQTRECLRCYLLNYFGETFESTGLSGCCLYCENQENQAADETNKKQSELMESQSEGWHPFALHSRVLHSTLGAGQVMRYEEDKMVVLFDDNGYTTLGVELVIENKLLEMVSSGNIQAS